MERDAAAEFWEKFEAETGEKVVARSMGTWYDRAGDDAGTWGILVLTDASFRFKYIPSENWLASLFKAARGGKRDRPVIDIAVPRTALLDLEEPRRGILARLLGSPFPRFAIAWKEGEERRSECFAAESDSDFMRALREAVSAASR